MTHFLSDIQTPQDCDLPKENGRTELTDAAWSGDSAEVETLLARGADPDRNDLHGDTPLIAAAKNNRTNALKALLQANANPSLKDVSGRTALSYALFAGHLDVANALVEANASSEGLDAYGRSNLDYAWHYRPGKDYELATKIARASGATSHKTRIQKLIPIRSDKDFATLDALKAWKGRDRLVRTAIVALALVALAIGESQLTMYGTLFSEWVRPYVDAPRWLSRSLHLATTFVLGSNLATLFAFILAPLVLGWPVIQARRAASLLASAGSESFDLDNFGGSARGLAGLLKSVGPVVVNRGNNRIASRSSSMKNPHLFGCLLIILSAAVAGWTTSLMINFIWRPFLLSEFSTFDFWAPVPWHWYFFEIGHAAAAAAAFLLLFSLLSRGAHVCLRRHLAAVLARKQRQRSAQIDLAVENLHGDGEPVGRSQVLYLRSFGQDNVLRIGNHHFDTTLAYALSLTADVVALGAPSDRPAPVAYPATGENWEERVTQAAHAARLVVMIPAATPGVITEMELLKREGLLEKTLFVAPPALPHATDRIRQMWAEVRAHPQLADFAIPAHVSAGFVFVLNNDGQLISWDTLGLEMEPDPLATPPQDTVSPRVFRYEHQRDHECGNGFRRGNGCSYNHRDYGRPSAIGSLAFELRRLGPRLFR